MLNIKNITTLAALICCLIICFAAPQKTFGQYFVKGSYLTTCFEPSYTKGADLYATCRPKSSSTAKYLGKLANYFECDGDIWNDDGALKCSRNPNSAAMQKAKAAIDGAMRSVLGTDVGGDYTKWIRLMFDLGMEEPFFQGLQPNEARMFFRRYLSLPENANLRLEVANRAFTDVYSYGANPKDIAFYAAKSTDYNGIVAAETLKLNEPEHKVLRRLMILAAYKKSFGRAPAAAEYDFWTTKKENFKQLIAANREYLYAPDGVKELNDTVKRALKDHGAGRASVNEINRAIDKYSQHKNIYDEM